MPLDTATASIRVSSHLIDPNQICCSCSRKYLSIPKFSITKHLYLFPNFCLCCTASFILANNLVAFAAIGSYSASSFDESMARTSTSARATAIGFLGGHTLPNTVSPSVTTSLDPPTSVHTTGNPDRPASPRARGKPSDWELLRKSHPCASTLVASAKPIKNTLADKPSAAINSLHSAV